MKNLLLLFLLCISGFVFGQKEATGIISDEHNQPLTGTTIVLLENQDSSMVAFAISDHKGRFILEGMPAGDYILQLSFLSYKTAYHDVTISPEESKTELGIFIMESHSEILQEVTVSAEHIPMGVIGDTISYNASAFKTRPGATVEDLLKKLPGVEVQRDGSIKAMGEDVENVLVDGKEFFGNDPTIATKNLEAEAVDKVQLYDKKSEISEFTGIDDGQEEKTINLQLKEEYKKGGFGKMELAAGSDDNYRGKLNYNRFSPSMQAATIISANNINEQAFSFNEYMQFMGGLSNAIAENNGMINFGEMGGGIAPMGVTDDISGGLNFNYDFTNNLKLTSHYFLLDIDRKTENLVNSSQFSESGTFNTIDSISNRNANQNHRLSARLAYDINPMTQVIFKNALTGLLTTNQNQSYTTFFSEGNFNGLTSRLQPDSKNQLGLESTLQLRRKFLKKGRSLLTDTRWQIGRLDQDIDVDNAYQFSNEETFLKQHQDFFYDNKGISINSSYTEPIGKRLYLGLKYQYDWNKENPRKEFYNIENEASILDSELSADYRKINNIHFGEISFRKNSKRWKVNGGLGIQRSQIKSFLEAETAPLNNISHHWRPNFGLEYEFSNNENMDFDYYTTVNLPTLNQLTPMPDNADPNILILGNPNLSPEYQHVFNWGFQSIDQFNYRNIFLRTSFAVVQNRIINSISIDDQFLKTLTPINTDLYKRVSGYASYSSPIRPLKIKYRLSSRYSWSNYTTSLNGSNSGVNESNVNLNAIIENRMKDRVDIASGIRLEYNHRDYDINSSFNQAFFNYRLFVDGLLYLGKWTLATSFDQVYFSGEFFSDTKQFQLWNASIQRSFKGEKLTLKVEAFDLLNQNKGFSRTGTINGLVDNTYNTLSRYVMIGVSYRLGKKRSGGLEITTD